MSATVTGVHPYADKFPILAEADLADLAESIRTNGLRQPVVLTEDGLILDGRNRAAACAQVGIEPETVVYDGSDLAEFVIDCNVTRRNMSTGARAMSTALVLAADGQRQEGRWAYGELHGSVQSQPRGFRSRLNECGVVLDFTPDAAERVVAGDLALNAAFEQADQIRRSAEADKVRERELKKRERDEAKAEAERNARIVADLTEAEQDQYVDLIESGAMPPASAWAAYMEDTRKEREAKAQAKRNAEQAAGGIARSVMALHALTDAAALDRFLATEWPLGHAGASPAARDRMTPQHFRDIADALNLLADSWKGTPNA